MKVEVVPFGEGYDEIIITNGDNVIAFSDLGARLTRWTIAGESIILPVESAADGLSEAFRYFGATIGRVAGRIKGAKFTLEGQEYLLEANEGHNLLHGGAASYDLKRWAYTIKEEPEAVEVAFTYLDPKGANGFPGNLQVKVTHRYDCEDRWTLTYEARADETTLFNPTNHVYFNLSGNLRERVFDHTLQLAAESYLPLDEEGLPTGDHASVKDTPFDLNKGRRLGEVILSEHPQIKGKQGLDHPFKLQAGEAISLSLGDHVIRCETDQAYAIIYTLNTLGASTYLLGQELKPYEGIAIEVQGAPDAINQSQAFGSIVLKANEPYRSQSSYQYLNTKKGK